MCMPAVSICPISRMTGIEEVGQHERPGRKRSANEAERFEMTCRGGREARMRLKSTNPHDDDRHENPNRNDSPERNNQCVSLSVFFQSFS